MKYLGYRFARQSQLYEIGVCLERYHEHGGARLLRLIFQVIACCVLVIVLFPLFFRVNLINPLKRLLDGVKQVNAGHLDIVIPVGYDDEIGFLTRAFNQMTHSLRISNQQKDDLNIALRQANDELEERVHQRTNELQKAKETAEEARRMAEDANRAKSTFLANMSHELRTPLNVILGFAQVLERGRELSPEQQKQVQAINRSGEHLLALINQVLDLSKIEANQMMVNEESINLCQLLTELEEMFCLRAQDKGLRLTFEHASDLPRYINTDAVKLRQILINLLDNAIKLTEKGEVTLRILDLEFEILDSKDSQRTLPNQKSQIFQPVSETGPVSGQAEILKFDISDTGPGIAPEKLETIFEAFTQAEVSKTGQPGTGLGLTISRRFVELLGGELTVDSKPGQGSTFSVTLPVKSVRAEDVSEKAAAQHIVALEPNQRAADGSRYRILLVDDQQDNRQVLLKILQALGPQTKESDEGFELQEAENGWQAVEIWKTWQPHLIFMDIRMPVMDGYEAIKHIRTLERQRAEARSQEPELPTSPSFPVAPVRIIALTASPFEREKADILKVGCDAYIRKPFRESTLFEMLAQYLNVRYVYAEKDARNETVMQKPALKPAALASLPDDMRAQFTQAITTLDIERLRTLIMRIRIDNAVLADALEELVNAYQFEKLSALFAGKEVRWCK
jgi:signal transduction histidine kinase/DNA-binding response OmpR family regulator